jgi:hypothetical protein
MLIVHLSVSNNNGLLCYHLNYYCNFFGNLSSLSINMSQQKSVYIHSTKIYVHVFVPDAGQTIRHELKKEYLVIF